MAPAKIKALNDNSSDESEVDEENPTVTREALVSILYLTLGDWGNLLHIEVMGYSPSFSRRISSDWLALVDT